MSHQATARPARRCKGGCRTYQPRDGGYIAFLHALQHAETIPLRIFHNAAPREAIGTGRRSHHYRFACWRKWILC